MSYILLPSKGKSNKKIKKKSLLANFLYIATALFGIWVLLLLFLIFSSLGTDVKEDSLMDKLHAISDLKMEPIKELANSFTRLLGENNEPEIGMEQFDKDEFNPPMKDLLKDRSFDQEKFDEVFENMKTPQITPKEPIHSTFGRNVIYIYHSHSRESFLPYIKDTNKPEDAYHSKANITLVGEMLGKALERRGMGTNVNSTDIVEELSLRGLDFSSSYMVSGEWVKSARAENKDLEIFLDIHRDSLRENFTTKELNGVNFASLLFVVGTGHENYAQNLQFTEGLNGILSKQYPGLSKGIITKDSSQGNGVYNQDISPNAVIVEIGGVDNSFEEINRTTEALADVISDYYWHGEK